MPRRSGLPGAGRTVPMKILSGSATVCGNRVYRDSGDLFALDLPIRLSINNDACTLPPKTTTASEHRIVWEDHGVVTVSRIPPAGAPIYWCQMRPSRWRDIASGLVRAVFSGLGAFQGN